MAAQYYDSVVFRRGFLVGCIDGGALTAEREIPYSLHQPLSFPVLPVEDCRPSDSSAVQFVGKLCQCMIPGKKRRAGMETEAVAQGVIHERDPPLEKIIPSQTASLIRCFFWGDS